MFFYALVSGLRLVARWRLIDGRDIWARGEPVSFARRGSIMAADARGTHGVRAGYTGGGRGGN